MVPPVVVYQSAVRDGDRVFTSGQLPMKDGQLMTPGKLGGAVSEEAGYAAARQCRLNALAAIDALVRQGIGGTLPDQTSVVWLGQMIDIVRDEIGHHPVAQSARL